MPDTLLDNLPGREATRAAITQEVRFAVVMYGGSSLAIYINGVTQELFNLVRATAVSPSNESSLYLPNHASKNKRNERLGGTEAVYRRLAQLLGTRNDDGNQKTSFKELSEDEADAVHTSFVIDIISGTSAGGLNGIFLAKALVNDQDLVTLKDMWLNEGAIETLLNDEQTRKAAQDSRITAQNPPQSLLSSQRMYCLLYDALQRMEQSAPRQTTDTSPYVNELDLFVTRTDIYGQPVSVRLSDNTVVTDLQHRDVLHFQYAEWLRNLKGARPNGLESDEIQGNDFLGENDRFLAYAARCTSAFPFAFEPMCLDDIRFLAGYGSDKEAFDKDARRWLRFFAESTDVAHSGPANLLDQIKQRPYTDGGVLDNKPFSFAIDTLRKRWSDKSVQRKLVYIEPSPQILPEEQPSLQKPDPLEIVSAALIGLPGYEAIHADLQRVLQRNGIIKRVNLITNELQKDIPSMEADSKDGAAPPASSASPQENGKKGVWAGGWKGRSYAEIIRERGVAYGAYHHLKMEAVTDALTSWLACQWGFKPGSQYMNRLRDEVAKWRDQNYDDSAPGKMQTDFLLHFDLDYRMRRLLFLRSRINLGIQGKENALDVSQNVLLSAKKDLRRIFEGLRGYEYRLSTLRSSDMPEPMKDYIRQAVMRDLENCPSGRPGRVPDAAEWENLERRLHDIQGEIYKATAEHQATAEQEQKKAATGEIRQTLSTIPRLQEYMANFEVYDSVLFPALYGTGVGETSEVALMRISPREATSLIDERTPGGRHKLAGTALGNFGALLQRSWRSNDIMWGRLDGAEQLIRSLAPNQMEPQELTRLIREAQRVIVTEEMLRDDQEAIVQWLTALIPQLPPQERTATALDKLVRSRQKTLVGNANLPDLTPIFECCLQADGLIAYLKTGYEVRREPPPRPALTAASRSAAIVGKILEGAAKKHQMDNVVVALLARSGQVFAGLVEVALPNSILHNLIRHWLKLAYLFEVFLIAGGVVLGSQWAQDFGLKALLVTALGHFGISIAHNYLQGQDAFSRFKRGALISLGLIVLILAGIGFNTFLNQVLPAAKKSIMRRITVSGR